jgi:hypothetical protein
MARYGAAAQKSVERAMRKRKRGTLKSRAGKRVRSEEQAVAIGLSEARERGAKVPPRPPRRASPSARYGEAARKSVERALRKRKRRTLKSGRTGRTVKSEEQAIAIGLSEARKRGAKVPPPLRRPRRKR